jgi:hypothetical protein
MLALIDPRRAIAMPNVRFAGFAVVLALALPSPIRADADPGARLVERLQAFLAGASRNDAAVHERFWAEDLVYTSSSGERFGKTEIMQGLSDAPPGDPSERPSYRGEDVDVRMLDGAAVVTFRLVAEMPGGSVQAYFNTGVFRRDNGQWRAFAWQATRIPENGEAQ